MNWTEWLTPAMLLAVGGLLWNRIDRLDSKFESKFDRLDTKFDTKFDRLTEQFVHVASDAAVARDRVERKTGT